MERKGIKIEDIIDQLAEKGYFTMKDVVAQALRAGFEDPQSVRSYAEDVLLERAASGKIRKEGENLYKGVG